MVNLFLIMSKQKVSKIRHKNIFYIAGMEHDT